MTRHCHCTSQAVNVENRLFRLPFLPLAGESWIGGNGHGEFDHQGWLLATPVSLGFILMVNQQPGNAGIGERQALDQQAQKSLAELVAAIG